MLDKVDKLIEARMNMQMMGRIAGMVDMRDAKVFKNTAANIGKDLLKEGFDGPDIIDYLQLLVEESVYGR